MEAKRMRKGVLLVIVSLTVIVFLGAGVLLTSDVEAHQRGTIYVDDDAPPGWYDGTHVRTIQEGVDNASVYDTIYVWEGVYSGNVDVGKTVTLIGNGTDVTTVFVVDVNDFGFNVTAHFVDISGFTVYGASSSEYRQTGICLYKVSYCDISDNAVVFCRLQSICLKSSSFNTISSNSVGFSDAGVYLESSSFNTVTGTTAGFCGVAISLKSSITNTIIGNNVSGLNGVGISLESSSFNTITGNTAAVFGDGINLTSSHGNTITDNTANSFLSSAINLTSSHINFITDNTVNTTLYGNAPINLASSHGNTISGNTANGSILSSGIYLESSNNNTVTGNTVYLEGLGATLKSSPTDNILGNTRSSFGDGITLEYSRNNTISGNTAWGWIGINLTSSSDNNITGNAASGFVGMGLYSSSGNNVIGNAASGLVGMGLYSSSGNNVNGNTVTNSTFGLSLDSSTGNIITDNTVTGNGIGIYLDSSNVNFIYNNIFKNEYLNAYDTGTNIWNFLKIPVTNIIGGPYLGGNYWSDYTGKDTDGDELGDTLLPYNSSGNISTGGDYHPLIYIDTIPPTTLKIVGTPKYGMNDEWVTSSTPFTLSATDDLLGYGVNHTYYRVWYNGLWSPWMEYTGAFTLSGECTHYVEFYSIDIMGNVEAVTNQTHYVDDTAPVTVKEYGVPYYSDGFDEWITTSTMIYLNASDMGVCQVGDYEVFYRIWDTVSGWSPWQSGGANTNVTLSVNEECQHYIEFYAVDALGNMEPVQNQTFFVDDTPPMATLEFGAPYYTDGIDEWITTSTLIYLNATEGGLHPVGGYAISFRVWDMVSGWGPWVPGTPGTNMSLSVGEECRHYIEFFAVDLLGNVAPLQNVSFFVDDTPPIMLKTVGDPYCVVLPDTEYCVTTWTPIYINITDDGTYPCIVGSIHARIGIFYGGQWTYTWSNYTGGYPGWLNLTLTFAEECVHVLNLSIYDDLGNGVFDEEIFNVDDTPPVIDVVVGDPHWPGVNPPYPDYWVTSVTPIIVSVFDGGCCPMLGLMPEYSINGGPWAPLPPPYIITFPEECVHNLSLRADDCLGNRRYCNVTFFVDNTPPRSWLELELDYWDQFITVYTEFTIWVEDLGLCPVGSYLVHYSILGPQGSEYYMGGSYFDCDGSWHIGELSKPVAWQIRDDSGYMPTGKYKVEYWAEDVLGNTEPVMHTEWFFADTTDPHTRLLFTGPYYEGDGEEWISSDTFIVLEGGDRGGGGSGVRVIKYRVDGGAEKTYTGPFSIEGEGLHTIHYYSIDHVNNREDEQAVTVIVDTAAPSSQLGFLGDTYTDESDRVWVCPSTSLQLTSEDGGCGLKTILYRVDQGAWVSYEEAFTLGEGMQSIEFYAEDNLGNTEVIHRNTLGIDGEAPRIVMDKPRANHLYIAGREILTLSLLKNTDAVVFGPLEIYALVTDTGCGSEKIQLFIDGEFRFTSYDDNLEWRWNKRAIGVHTLEIRTQDALGHTNSKEVKIWIFNL